jgi:hyaluronan synthase
MLPYVGKYLSAKQFASPIYGLVQLLVAPMMLAYIAATTLLSGGDRYANGPYVLFAYIGAYVVVRYGLSALYLIGRPNVSLKHKILLFVLGTPAAVILNLFLLTPTRYFALTKLFDNRWQTRELSAKQISQLSQMPSVGVADAQAT